MKSFLQRLVLFGLFVVFAAFLIQEAIHFRCTKLFARSTGILEESAGVNADLVLLGSSRCYMQLHARFFDTCFHLKTANLGMPGHSELPMAIIRLKQYLLDNRPPRYAILAFDPYSLAGTETNNTNFVYKDKFAIYSYFPKKQNMPIVDYFGFTWQERYVPLYSAFKYGLAKEFFSRTDLTSHMEMGNDIYSEEWDTVANPVIRRKPTTFESEKQQLTAELKKLRDFCAVHNIKLLCLQTPIHSSFYDSVAFSSTGGLCRGLQLPFVDVNADSIMQNIHLFYSPNHLNKRGIAIMNDALSRNADLRAFLATDRL
jgi:hypothetical protein